ncbi:MAG: ASCH domain-containing protein [Clostridia bacterium]|nr:ASCH domain-containing protein [Clostridia bacterium]
MIHTMKLNEKPFTNIDNGVKKIELRLYDEKRSKITLNDYIVFQKITDLSQTIKVKVVGLLRYNSFEDLFKDIDFNICGPANSLEEKLDNIHKIYSIEEEKKYRILAIRIEKV